MYPPPHSPQITSLVPRSPSACFSLIYCTLIFIIHDLVASNKYLNISLRVTRTVLCQVKMHYRSIFNSWQSWSRALLPAQQCCPITWPHEGDHVTQLSELERLFTWPHLYPTTRHPVTYDHLVKAAITCIVCVSSVTRPLTLYRWKPGSGIRKFKNSGIIF